MWNTSCAICLMKNECKLIESEDSTVSTVTEAVCAELSSQGRPRLGNWKGPRSGFTHAEDLKAHLMLKHRSTA